MIYLDSAATTKIDPEVLEEMMPYLQDLYGNPSAKYLLAKQAADAVEQSREKVAHLINAETTEIVFTSGATEGNNFIIKGVADALSHKGKHIITSSIEHKSIIESCKYLEKHGYSVSYLKPDSTGKISPESLKSAISEGTILISLFWVNNELGTINPISQLAQICKERDIHFHTDATQAIGKEEIDLQKLPISSLSLSAHKVYGPKGVGACFLRKTKLGTKQSVTPLLHGGEQEFGYRGGTLAVPLIVGLGKAAEVAMRDHKKIVQHLTALESKIIQCLEKTTDYILNGCPKNKAPGILSVTFPGVNNELLVKLLHSSVGISTGSACSSTKSSHVLSEVGFEPKTIQSTIRLSLSKYNNLDEVEGALLIVAEQANHLRAVGHI